MSENSVAVKKSRLSRTTRAWLAVVGACLCLFSVSGAFYGTTALIIKPMAERFGTDVAAVGVFTSFWSVGVLIAALISTVIMSKLNLNGTAILGGVVGALGTILMGIAPNLPVAYCGGFITGLATVWGGAAIVQITVSKWFFTGRATLLAITAFAESAGTTVIAMIMAGAIEGTGDYTPSMWIAGIIILVCCLVAGIFLLRGKPEDYGWLPIGAEKIEEFKQQNASGEVPGIAAKDALRTKQLWLFFIAGIVLNMGYYLMYSQQAPYATTIAGFTAAQAAILVSVASWSKSISKIIYGVIGDRFSLRPALAITIIVGLVGALCMYFSMSFAGLVVAAIGLGFANSLAGAGTLTYSRMFGQKALLKLGPLPHAANAIGVIIAPLIFRALYDGEASGYKTIIMLMFIFELIYFAIIVFILRRKYMFEERQEH